MKWTEVEVLFPVEDNNKIEIWGKNEFLSILLPTPTIKKEWKELVEKLNLVYRECSNSLF